MARQRISYMVHRAGSATKMTRTVEELLAAGPTLDRDKLSQLRLTRQEKL